ncbi:MAG: STAS/SEC14 domain-containing protein [Arcobacteraceae bacterium]|nr:STAS/SEC14 domain-containing protein [Arcobacteraceae bacterium]
MLEFNEHGISIGISRIDGTFFMKLTIDGTLKHSDFEIMTPLIENAIKGIDDPKIKVLVDARNFKGWEAQALWDDFKFGMEYEELFTKIAFIGNKQWEEYSIKIANWFMITDIEYFENMKDAVNWLNEEIIEQDIVQKELSDREEDIRDSLENLFVDNIKITNWDVPEANNQEASEILIDILSKKLEEIKVNVKNGKYENY